MKPVAGCGPMAGKASAISAGMLPDRAATALAAWEAERPRAVELSSRTLGCRPSSGRRVPDRRHDEVRLAHPPRIVVGDLAGTGRGLAAPRIRDPARLRLRVGVVAGQQH